MELFSAIAWFFGNLAYAVVNFFYALINPHLWLDWSDKQALVRFIYYGASTELFFVYLLSFVIIAVAGLLHRPFLWGVVRTTEGISCNAFSHGPTS